MMKIDITGPQGIGKTILARKIKDFLEERDLRVKIVEEGYIDYKSPRCRKFDVEISCSNPLKG